MQSGIKNPLVKAIAATAGTVLRDGALKPTQTSHVTCGRSKDRLPPKFLLDTLRIRNVVAADSRMPLNGPMTPKTIRQTHSPLRAAPSVLNAA